jgi:hypothetical protein
MKLRQDSEVSPCLVCCGSWSGSSGAEQSPAQKHGIYGGEKGMPVRLGLLVRTPRLPRASDPSNHAAAAVRNAGVWREVDFRDVAQTRRTEAGGGKCCAWQQPWGRRRGPRRRAAGGRPGATKTVVKPMCPPKWQIGKNRLATGPARQMLARPATPGANAEQAVRAEAARIARTGRSAAMKFGRIRLVRGGQGFRTPRAQVIGERWITCSGDCWHHGLVPHGTARASWRRRPSTSPRTHASARRPSLAVKNAAPW